MKQSIILLTIFLCACNSKQNSEKALQSTEPDSVIAEQLPVKLIDQEPKPNKQLYLNGIYEYDYPYDTKDMNENQYIAFKKEGDSVKAWYFGTSDEFDEAREGYLPGYFVSRIKDLTTKEDSIFFSISTGYSQCYSHRFPIGFVDTTKLNRQYEKWAVAYGPDQTIRYSGKLDGLQLYVNMFGETRTYRKTRNYFHPGIDNYDSTKCRTEPLLTINQNLENLNKQMVLDFLNTFSVTCEANVEFGEWSNELLFKILFVEPTMTLEVLSKNLNELDTISIYQELESPLHDLIPIDSIITKIEQLNIDEQIKKSVLGRLGNPER